MDPDLEKVQEVLAEAVARPAGAERNAYLDTACGHDQPLRAKVEALIAAYESANNFLEAGVIPETEPLLSEQVGAVIGRYKLLQQIGEGGFGLVYMAEQTEPVRRKVALKIIKAGMDSREVIARFEAERQALALMDHPNIAKVFDGGVVGSSVSQLSSPIGASDPQLSTLNPQLPAGRPYFVMELVNGIRITEYCDLHNLSTQERLEVFIQVCHGVQHAHQKGIIHRDIKPSNILVTVIDGEPVPKIIDFGIAKALGQQLTDKTLFTAFQQMLGTPTYMSPEQAELSGVDIDTRSDIYSLGVLLYELLTGVTPFDKETLCKAGLDEIRRIIRETEPPKPSTRLRGLGEKLTEVAEHRHTGPAALSRILHGELDWIVMKALEKDRSRRYETANSLLEDVDRHLRHEAVSAGAPSPVYRTRKFMRRHRVALGLMSVVTLVLAVGLIFSLMGFTRARRERDHALVAERRAQESARLEAAQLQRAEAAVAATDIQRKAAAGNLRIAQISLIEHCLDQGEVGPALASLEDQRADVNLQDSRSLEWRYLWKRAHQGHRTTLRGHENSVCAVAFVPGANLLVSGGEDCTVRIWDTVERVERQILARAESSIFRVAVSPDGGTLAWGEANGVLTIWDFEENRQRASVWAHNGGIAALAFSPDSRLIATGGYDGTARIWKAATGTSAGPLLACSPPPDSAKQVQALAFSPDGQTLAFAEHASVALWDLKSQSFKVRMQGHRFPFTAMAYLPDGKTLISGGGNNPSVNFSDVQLARQQKTFQPAIGNVATIALSPDGALLAIGSESGSIEVRDLAAGVIRKFGHAERIRSLAFSGDSKTLASAADDRIIKLWDLTQEQDPPPLHDHQTVCWDITYSPDGKLLLPAGDGGFEQRDAASGRLLRYEAGISGPVAFAPDGKVLSGYNLVWGLEGRQPVPEIPRPLGFVAAFSPDGATLAWGGGDGVTLFDWKNRQTRARLTAHPGFVCSLAVSPDGATLASAGHTEAMLWDLRSGRHKLTIPLACECVAFSPDGTILATGSKSGGIALWTPETGALLADLPAHVPFGLKLAFSPDGKTVVASNARGGVTVWDVQRGIERANLNRKNHAAIKISFSPDGYSFATSAHDGSVAIWRAANQEEVCAQGDSFDPRLRLARKLEIQAVLLQAAARSQDALHARLQARELYGELDTTSLPRVDFLAARLKNEIDLLALSASEGSVLRDTNDSLKLAEDLVDAARRDTNRFSTLLRPALLNRCRLVLRLEQQPVAPRPASAPGRPKAETPNLLSLRSNECERVLSVMRQTLGAGHPETLRAMTGLAEQCEHAGGLAQGLELREAALAGYRQTLGTDHPQTVEVMKSLAALYQTSTHTSEAKELWLEAERIWSRVLGPDHPAVQEATTRACRQLLSRGYDLCLSNSWVEAAHSFAAAQRDAAYNRKVAEGVLGDAEHWFALAFVRSGDLQALRALCQQLATGDRKTNDGVGGLVRAILLPPHPGPELLTLASNALPTSESLFSHRPSDVAWFRLDRSLLEYRSARYAEALASARQAARFTGPCHKLDCLVLQSMACKRLGSDAEALAFLRQANEFAAELRKHWRNLTDTRNLLLIECLLDEANGLIGQPERKVVEQAAGQPEQDPKGLPEPAADNAHRQLLAKGRELCLSNSWVEAAQSFSAALRDSTFNWKVAEAVLGTPEHWFALSFVRSGDLEAHRALCQQLVTAAGKTNDGVRGIVRAILLPPHPGPELLALASNALPTSEPTLFSGSSTSLADLSWFRLNRSLLEYRSGRYIDALASARQASEFIGHGSKLRSLILQSMACARLGSGAEALAFLRQAKELAAELPNPQGPDTCNLLLTQCLLDEANGLIGQPDGKIIEEALGPPEQDTKLLAQQAAYTTHRQLLANGRELCLSNRWVEAAHIFAPALRDPAFNWKVAEAVLGDAEHWFALSFVRSGDLEAHRAFCQQLATAVGKTNPAVGDLLQVILLPDHPGPELLAFAGDAIQASESLFSAHGFSLAWFRLNRSLLEYRSGRYPEALASARQALEWAGPYCKLNSLIIQSMACQRLGSHAEALGSLRQANESAAELRKRSKNFIDTRNFLLLECLLDEANGLIGGPGEKVVKQPVGGATNARPDATRD